MFSAVKHQEDGDLKQVNTATATVMSYMFGLAMRRLAPVCAVRNERMHHLSNYSDVLHTTSPWLTCRV